MISNHALLNVVVDGPIGSQAGPESEIVGRLPHELVEMIADLEQGVVVLAFAGVDWA